MPRFNRQMPDVTLQWRAVGHVGIMLVQSGEYESLTQTPRGRLHLRPTRQVAKELNGGFLRETSEKALVRPIMPRFLGHNTAEYVHVGFAIDPEDFIDERHAITKQLDTMNRVPGDWRHEFQPYLSIATLHHYAAEPKVLAAFQEIMPETVTLYGAMARVG